jgi:hypothetical protein
MEQIDMTPENRLKQLQERGGATQHVAQLREKRELPHLSEKQIQEWLDKPLEAKRPTNAVDCQTLVESMTMLDEKLHGFYESARKFGVRLEPIMRPEPAIEAAAATSDPLPAESQMRYLVRAMESTIDSLSSGLNKVSARLELL